MELLKVGEIESVSFEKVFKSGFLGVSVAFTVASTMQIFAVWAYLKLGLSILIFLIISMFCVLFLFFSIYDFSQKFKPSNWLKAISNGVIYIKFRSYLLNHSNISDEVIVCIKPSEILFFKETQVVDIIGRVRSKTRRESIYLDLVLACDLTRLHKALISEYSNRNEFSNYKLEKTWINFPVIISNQNVLRINIPEIRPNRNILFKYLKKLGIKELEKVTHVFDLIDSNPENIEINGRVLELLNEGRRIDARDAVRHIFDVNHKHAGNMINEIFREYCLKYT